MPWRGSRAGTDARVRAPGRIFVSYRREDAGGHVLALLPLLRARFGARRVFKDTDSIPPGVDFLAALKGELASCAAMLVVIGRDWLTVEDARRGTRRLDNPDDLVRLEVSTALENTGIRVVPVLVEGARMPGPDDLPADLRPLVWRNAVEVSDSRFNADADALIRVLEEVCGRQSDPRRRAARIGIAAAVVLLAGALTALTLVLSTADGGSRDELLSPASPPVSDPSSSGPRPSPQTVTGPAPAGNGSAPAGNGSPPASVEGETAKADAGPTGVQGRGAPAAAPSGRGSRPRLGTSGSTRADTPQASPTATAAEDRTDVRGPETPRPDDAAARREREQEQSLAAIRDTLERFRQAYNQKNEAAMQLVFPGVRADRMFALLRDCAALNLTFHDMRIQFISAAEALVDVQSVYGCRPRTGQGERKPPPVSDTFRLERRNDSWVIGKRQISLD